jgi:hypothetical protein
MLYHERLGYDCECLHIRRTRIVYQRLTAKLLQVVALSGGVGMRLLGICIASFSSGSFNGAFP